MIKYKSELCLEVKGQTLSTLEFACGENDVYVSVDADAYWALPFLLIDVDDAKAIIDFLTAFVERSNG